METRIQGSEPNVPKPVIRYQLGNHLGSASLEVDDSLDAQIITYEEYFPYGSTSYHSVRNNIEVPPKRYRYTGKERDEETGFNYHGARYYVPWLSRWLSCDPAGVLDGLTIYKYAQNNPISNKDSSGLQTDFPPKYVAESCDWRKLPLYMPKQCSITVAETMPVEFHKYLFMTQEELSKLTGVHQKISEVALEMFVEKGLEWSETGEIKPDLLPQTFYSDYMAMLDEIEQELRSFIWFVPVFGPKVSDLAVDIGQLISGRTLSGRTVDRSTLSFNIALKSAELYMLGNMLHMAASKAPVPTEDIFIYTSRKGGFHGNVLEPRTAGRLFASKHPPEVVMNASGLKRTGLIGLKNKPTAWLKVPAESLHLFKRVEGLTHRFIKRFGGQHYARHPGKMLIRSDLKGNYSLMMMKATPLELTRFVRNGLFSIAGDSAFVGLATGLVSKGYVYSSENE